MGFQSLGDLDNDSADVTWRQVIPRNLCAPLSSPFTEYNVFWYNFAYTVYRHTCKHSCEVPNHLIITRWGIFLWRVTYQALKLAVHGHQVWKHTITTTGTVLLEGHGRVRLCGTPDSLLLLLLIIILYFPSVLEWIAPVNLGYTTVFRQTLFWQTLFQRSYSEATLLTVILLLNLSLRP